MGLMAVLNLTGAIAYANRIPKNWYPRRLDIFGNSHRILHILFICAGMAQMFGLLSAFEFVHNSCE